VRRAADRFLQMGAVAVVVASDSAADANFARAGDAMARGRYGVDTADGTAYWPDRVAGARRRESPPIIWVRRGLGDLLRAPGQRLRARLTTENFVYPSVNLVGRVRGTDPALRDEHLLYSSHQDHDGVRTPIAGDSIWNGADDNASGSVAILAIARAFARQPARRSALFVWHGSEERGLIGSRYHVMHPMVPKDRIVAVLNAEMMGRNHPDSMTILGAVPPHRNSAALVAMARRANDETARFALDTLWDLPSHPEGWYFRSDHLPYARARIPAIAFSSNLHEDYHTPRDEPSRIDYAKLTRVTRWMYATGWMVANASQRPPVDPGFALER
jgi:Zn-dependent M28 family amino/carboxypeptidase